MFSHITETSSHTSSAGKGGMLNLGLVKKAIFSLQEKKTTCYNLYTDFSKSFLISSDLVNCAVSLWCLTFKSM